MKKRYDRDLRVCLAAAKAGAEILKKNYGKNFKTRLKDIRNPVTEIDEKAQRAILKVLRTHCKTDAVLAEEGDFSTTAEAPRRWIVDPLDGTTNFAHGYPMFCVSVALEEEGQSICGVVWDPLRNEIFTATKGQGAFLNKKRIRVSKVSRLIEALLVTGFAYDLQNPEFNNVPVLNHLLFETQAIRRDGSAALDLAYVAAGRYDSFWEFGINAWDVAAGNLMIEEAGGKISRCNGEAYELKDHDLLATNVLLHEDLLKHIQKSRASS